MNIFFVIDCFWHRSRTKTHYKLSETEQLLDQFSARLSLCPVSILKLLFTLYAEIYESLSRPVFGQDKSLIIMIAHQRQFFTLCSAYGQGTYEKLKPLVDCLFSVACYVG